MMTPEQKENIKLWVEALRSGKYKQTKNALRNGGAFCCLGVACDLFQSKIGGEWEGDSFVIGIREEDVHLPPPAQDLLGIDRVGSTPQYVKTPDGEALAGLAELNDEGFSFEQIADVIEQQFLAEVPA